MMNYRAGSTSLMTLALAAAVLSGAANLLPPIVAAPELAAPEYKIKAAFLYNFAKLTEWPADAYPEDTSPFTIGVLGQDPFDTALKETVEGKKIAGRPINIVYFTQLDEIENCQLLFISGSEQRRLAGILYILNERPILTVSDIDGCAGQGVIIGLLKRGMEVRFEINRQAAGKNKIVLSSKLLRLAEKTFPPPGKEAR